MIGKYINGEFGVANHCDWSLQIDLINLSGILHHVKNNLNNNKGFWYPVSDNRTLNCEGDSPFHIEGGETAIFKNLHHVHFPQTSC